MRAAGRSNRVVSRTNLRPSRIQSTTASQQTPEEKDEIYRLRYRAYLREGAILPSESQRVTDRYDDEPNNLHLRRLLSRRTLQLDSYQRSLRRVARCRLRRRCLAISCIRNSIAARSSSIPRGSWPTPTRPGYSPELPYATVRLGYVACGHFNADIGLGNRARRAPGVLSQGVPAGTAGRAEIVSRPDQAGRTDGRQLSGHPRPGIPALSVHAFERFRAPDAVHALGRASRLPRRNS